MSATHGPICYHACPRSMVPRQLFLLHSRLHNKHSRGNVFNEVPRSAARRASQQRQDTVKGETRLLPRIHGKLQTLRPMHKIPKPPFNTRLGGVGSQTVKQAKGAIVTPLDATTSPVLTSNPRSRFYNTRTHMKRSNPSIRYSNRGEKRRSPRILTRHRKKGHSPARTRQPALAFPPT